MLGACVRITWDLVKIKMHVPSLQIDSGGLGGYQRSGCFAGFPRDSDPHQCWRALELGEPQRDFQLKHPFILKFAKPGVRKHRRQAFTSLSY